MTSNFLPAGLDHSLFVPSTGMRAFSVELSPTWHRQTGGFDEPVYFTNGSLTGLMLRLYNEFRNPDSLSEFSVESLTFELFSRVSGARTSCKNTPPPWVDIVTQILHDCFSERIRLADLAIAAGVHQVHLARAFHRYKGCTLGEYVRRLRIGKACTQLGRADLSIADVALSNGFSDQSHFTNTFRRETGITPRQFRKIITSH